MARPARTRCTAGADRAVWLTDAVAEVVRRNWRAYPAMTDVAGCRSRIAQAGYRLIGEFVLPESDWWDAYYTPMCARVESLREVYAGQPVAERVLDACASEAAVYRDHADCYGYCFFVVARG